MFSLALLLLIASPSADDLARARTHYQAGKAHYELGQYEDAAREFAAGYGLSPRPEFLINLGQAYRGAGQPKKALEMFEKYLERAPSEARERAQVEQLAGELRLELAKEKAEEDVRRDAEAASSPSAPAPGSDTPRVTTLTPTEPVGNALVAPEPQKTSALVWALPLGVLVAGGIAAAIIIPLATNPVQCSGATGLGCVDLRQR